MAYRIRSKLKPKSELRRILVEQNQKSLRLLQTWERDPADHIHRSRQSFKRIRACLWLVRPDYRYLYMVENRTYRDLARKLSYARDASAMVEAADLLASRLWEPGPRESLLMLRKSLLIQAEQELADALVGMESSVSRVIDELPALAARLERLPLQGLKRRQLRVGARATLARAGRNYARIKPTADPESYHEWRKHVKYAYYQTALMGALMPRWSARRRSTLRELAELLGQAQDLHMLETLITAQPDALGIDLHWRRLHRTVHDMQRELQGQSAALGKQLFGNGQPGRADVIPLRADARQA